VKKYRTIIRSKYPIAPEMLRDFNKIAKITDDGKRAEVIAAYYTDQGALDCFSPFKVEEEPITLQTFLQLSPKDQLNSADPLDQECRDYLDHKRAVIQVNKSNKKFVKETLLPAYTRIEAETQIEKCNHILDRHNKMRGGRVLMGLDDVQKTYFE